MRQLSSILLLLLLALQACASEHDRKASEQEVLAATKKLASEDCTPPSSHGLRIAGCDYQVAFLDGQWSVLVHLLAVGSSGKPGYFPGGSYLYRFEADGKFIERIQGM